MDEAPDNAEHGETGESAAPAQAPKRGLITRFKDYIWDWRAVVAVGIALFIVGGLSGLVLGLAMDGGHRHHGFRDGHGGYMRPGPWGGFGPGQGPGAPRG